MRIDDLNVAANGASTRAGAVETTSVQLSGSKAERAAAGPGNGDSVELSGLSQILQASASRRDERVQSLAAQVRGGGYTVDANAVSQSLVQETLANSALGSHA